MTSPAIHRFFPETAAGGFSRVDGTIAFFTRLNALLHPGMMVLEFGAGRGAYSVSAQSPFKTDLRRLKGKVARVIGVDLDPIITSNASLDEAHVLALDDRGFAKLPLADRSVDLIVSDYTFEHIAEPLHVVAEFDRVLRPGGWICARTPNRWGYIGIGANLLSNRLHARLLRLLQPERKEEDVFPTRYRMNTLSTLNKLFPSPRFIHYSYGINPEPVYVAESRAGWRCLLLWSRLAPEALSSVLLVFIRKQNE